jgi:M6 family metalloprotease-like protein
MTKLTQRWDRINECVKTYEGSTSGYVNIISIVNADGDGNNANGRVLASPVNLNITFLAHETGHTFGWDHSYNDSTEQPPIPWERPGEYQDAWDIMSAYNVHPFHHPIVGTAGPGMNAPYTMLKGFIPNHRIFTFKCCASQEINLAALNHPEANGPLVVVIPTSDPKHYFTIEYRTKTDWDQGIPRNAVLIHEFVDGKSILKTFDSPERLENSTSKFIVGSTDITVKVQEFTKVGYIAKVKIDATPRLR